MSQKIILNQLVNYLINKRALLELKSHWNNINMASSIHMAQRLFCFVFTKNEDVALERGKVPTPAQQVFTLTGHIFKASYSTSATQANQI